MYRARQLSRTGTLTMGAGTALALGWNTPVIAGVTLGVMLLILGILMIVGAVLWASRAGQLKQFGQVLTVLSLALVVIMVIALAVKPAEVSPAGPTSAQFKVLSVGGLTGCSYSDTTHIFTVAMNVNTTAHSITVAQLKANFTLQRTDQGSGTTDVKTVTATASQSSVTDANTGLSYNTFQPNNYGQPKVNWTLMPGDVTVTYSLSSQLGLTPYQSGSFAITIDFGKQAFTVTQTTANDIINAGSISLAGITYQINVVIGTVST